MHLLDLREFSKMTKNRQSTPLSGENGDWAKKNMTSVELGLRRSNTQDNRTRRPPTEIEDQMGSNVLGSGSLQFGPPQRNMINLVNSQPDNAKVAHGNLQRRFDLRTNTTRNQRTMILFWSKWATFVNEDWQWRGYLTYGKTEERGWSLTYERECSHQGCRLKVREITVGLLEQIIAEGSEVSTKENEPSDKGKEATGGTLKQKNPSAKGENETDMVEMQREKMEWKWRGRNNDPDMVERKGRSMEGKQVGD
ncbi:hypothetical protein C8R47DRAFT_1065145 [Mycena vitilis]|nr:hypothetical protein C8R47DRAFT_1065145 [Mycena vitilis]